MTEVLNDLSAYIKSALKKDVENIEIANSELCLTVKPAKLHKVINYLRDDSGCLFNQLMDICGVDYPNRADRFEIVYNLLSLRYNNRIRVKTSVAEDCSVDSVADIFSTAIWFEREVWDMYGVAFDNNPDLRRILTDYGFEGHPLRKDFPLTGFVELSYDEEKKETVYKPVELMQDFRKFDFTSPWEAMTEVQKASEDKDFKPLLKALKNDEAEEA